MEYKGGYYRIQQPINRIRIRDDLLDIKMDDYGSPTYKFTEKIAARCAEIREEAIVDEIIRAATEAGVTELYLIDKEFIISAIKNEIARRNGEVISNGLRT